jgi:hypothetical protein
VVFDDGGELATAIRHNVKIVVLLLTDNDLPHPHQAAEKGNPIYGRRCGRGTIGGDNIFGVPSVRRATRWTCARN